MFQVEQIIKYVFSSGVEYIKLSTDSNKVVFGIVSYFYKWLEKRDKELYPSLMSYSII